VDRALPHEGVTGKDDGKFGEDSLAIPDFHEPSLPQTDGKLRYRGTISGITHPYQPYKSWEITAGITICFS